VHLQHRFADELHSESVEVASQYSAKQQQIGVSVELGKCEEIYY